MTKMTVSIMLGLGIALLVLGVALGGLSAVTPRPLSSLEQLLGVVGMLLGLTWLRQETARRLQEYRLRHTSKSELAEKLVPQLMGSYSPYVVEAAETLSEARDATAVPALLYVLERCVDTHPVGWRDQAEAIVHSLTHIGDRRALPLLYRLENVRGIGIIPSIRQAIAAIEPQTSLLRAGSEDSMSGEMLLRSALTNSEDSPAILLRQSNKL